MSAPAPSLAALANLLRAEGGLLADEVCADLPPEAPHGDLAASGPRAQGHETEFALLVEAVREGYLQHYAEGRVLVTEDPDLALLAGDRLYALGLERLAELGDLEAVAALADLISDSARLHAEGRPDDSAKVWEAGVRAVGRGRPGPA